MPNYYQIINFLVLFFICSLTFASSPVGKVSVKKIDNSICFQVSQKHFDYEAQNKIRDISVLTARGVEPQETKWSAGGIEFKSNNCIQYGTFAQREDNKTSTLDTGIPYRVSIVISSHTENKIRTFDFIGHFCLKNENDILNPYYDKNKETYVCEKKNSWWKRIFHW